jgi:hypothetical protein
MVQDDSEDPKSKKEPIPRIAASVEEVRKVFRLARKGEIHPDPQIAASALRWAKIVLASEPQQPTAFGRKSSYLAATLADLIHEGNSGPAMLDRRVRKNAQNIVWASARHSVGQDPPDPNAA